MNKPNNIKTWYTQSEYVDIQTGEQIKKNEAENKYIIIRKKIKYEINNDYGIRRIINECTREGKQIGIW